MRYPEIKNIDFAPFLGALVQIQEQVVSVIPSVVDPQERELFEGLLEQIRINSAKLEVEGPLWLAETKASLADSVAKHKAATATQEEVLHSLAGLKEKIAAQIVVTKAKAAASTAKIKTLSPTIKIRTLIWITQNFIRFSHFFEAILCNWIWIYIWM